MFFELGRMVSETTIAPFPTGILCEGTGAVCQLLNVIIVGFPGTFENAIHIKDSTVGTQLFLDSSAFCPVGICNNGILVDNSTFYCQNTSFAFIFNTVFQVINGSQLYVNNSFIDQATSTGTNLEVDSTSSIFSSNVNFRTDRLNIDPNATISINYPEDSIDNGLGLHLLGQTIFGTRDFPSDVFFGEGAESVAGLQILKFNGSTFTDSTADILPSGVGSVSLFDDLTNSVFYVGDDIEFSTILYDVETIMSGGVIVCEFWNGLAWQEFNTMAVNVNYPYDTRANLPLLNVGDEEILFDISLLQNSNWATTTINSSLKYWMRFRITSTLTTSPIINSFKNYTNTTSINKSGAIFHYGLSQGIKILPFDINLFRPAGSTPANQDIFFSDNIAVGRTRNSFDSGEGVGICFYVPTDLLSASKITLRLGYTSSNTATSQSDFEFILNVATLAEGDQVFLSSTSGEVLPDEQQIITNLPINQTNGQFLNFINIDFYNPNIIVSNSSGYPSGLICFQINRGSDSNANSLILSQTSLFYYSYKTTGSVI